MRFLARRPPQHWSPGGRSAEPTNRIEVYRAFASFTPSVPEPETYVMLLAGLGLLGFAARRRKQKVV
jgi:hypothetical protein